MAGLFAKWFKKSQEDRLKTASVSDTAVVAQTENSKKEKNDNSKTSDVSTISWGNIVIGELTTEKSLKLKSDSVYTFNIARYATKRDVASVIWKMFGVSPEKITIINSEGKNVRWGKTKGKRQNTKKAYVKLKKGETIPSLSRENK